MAGTRNKTPVDLSEDDFLSSDDESGGFLINQTKKITPRASRGQNDEDLLSDEQLDELHDEDDNDEDDDEDDDEVHNPLASLKTGAEQYKKDKDLNDDELNEIMGLGGTEDGIELGRRERKRPSKKEVRSKKLKNLTPQQLEEEQKKIKKTGVCYLSRIPPYMKPAKLRNILTRFGKIDRLFLKPEDTAVHQKRVKYGGNKKKNFTEGWVEFVKKKDAKLCEATMNGQIIGGRKGSYYYDDVMNIKYLKGFKWLDLTQQIARDNEVRQAKLSLELSQQQKLNKTFVSNVEKSKMVKNIQQKRKAKEEKEGKESKEVETEMRRQFKQRKVTSTRADADEKLKEKAQPNDKLNGVLSKVF